MTWPGIENIEQYFNIDNDGNYCLKSMDEDMCEIILSKNMLHFRVSYLHLIKNKKLEYI